MNWRWQFSVHFTFLLNPEQLKEWVSIQIIRNVYSICLFLFFTSSRRSAAGSAWLSRSHYSRVMCNAWIKWIRIAVNLKFGSVLETHSNLSSCGGQSPEMEMRYWPIFDVECNFDLVNNNTRHQSPHCQTPKTGILSQCERYYITHTPFIHSSMHFMNINKIVIFSFFSDRVFSPFCWFA